ncbi:MAG: threonine synthase [Eubacterium sp.]|jgi:threonine synthase|nr:threonine synthase [Eubacterium sp.]
MKYISTRNSFALVSGAQAVFKGLSDDGGLFVPERFPELGDLSRFCDMKYPDLAYEIFKLYLTDFSDGEVRNAVNSAYGDNFDTPDIVAVPHLTDEIYMLELWHGPTCAFKDMALQALPHLLTASAEKVSDGKEAVILVATSGDTGKAALEGFRDVPGTRIMVFYPENGVSEMQKRQMTTQEGDNVGVCGVRGNFDDCQNAVKEIFNNSEIKKKLFDKNMIFSSANSINWGRLLPQIVYYIFSYVRFLKDNIIENGEKINIVVPTGNFGNILAAYIAMEMGLPVNRLICASNSNKVLTDFINTGVYDRNRKFTATVSPSMDILISSNLERLLYLLCGRDDQIIVKWFGELKQFGRYQVYDDVRGKMGKLFYGGYCDEEGTIRTVKEVFDGYSYLLDTHTAVAYSVYKDYKLKTGDKTKTIVASTANPYKFVNAVYKSLTGESPIEKDEFKNAEIVEKITGVKMPAALREMRNKPTRFSKSVEREEIASAVLEFIGDVK